MQKSFNHLGEVPSDQHGEYITVIAPKHTVELKKKKTPVILDWPVKNERKQTRLTHEDHNKFDILYRLKSCTPILYCFYGFTGTQWFQNQQIYMILNSQGVLTVCSVNGTVLSVNKYNTTGYS